MDNVISISFSVGGFFDGHTITTINKTPDGAVVEIMRGPNYGGQSDHRQISIKEWQDILDKLYRDLHIQEWKRKYVDPKILDGTQWDLTITLANGRKKEYYGSNAYPPNWGEVEKLFDEL